MLDASSRAMRKSKRKVYYGKRFPGENLLLQFAGQITQLLAVLNQARIKYVFIKIARRALINVNFFYLIVAHNNKVLLLMLFLY